MRKAALAIGTCVIVLLLFCVPILTTCSLCLKWHGFVTTVFVTFLFMEFVGVVSYIYDFEKRE